MCSTLEVRVCADLYVWIYVCMLRNIVACIDMGIYTRMINFWKVSQIFTVPFMVGICNFIISLPFLVLR